MSDGGWMLLDPWFLALGPLALLVWIWRLRRPRAALPSADLGFLRSAPRSLRERTVWLPEAALVLAAAALSLALARPVRREILPLREQGVDILLVMDVSSSMNETDMDEGGRLSRIAAAREEASRFVAGRPHDRIGLVTFALFPDLRCPLTLDHRALRAFIEGVDTVPERSPENRTAIGVALAEAVRLLDKSEARSKVVVLLTDGQNNVAEVQPLDAARLAKDAGIRVHTIGIGQGTVIQSPFGGKRVIPTDFSELQKIAEITGGRFFRARDADGLARTYREIDAMEKVELEDPRYRISEAFMLPLLAGCGLLALALMADLSWIREAP